MSRIARFRPSRPLRWQVGFTGRRVSHQAKHYAGGLADAWRLNLDFHWALKSSEICRNVTRW